MSQTRRGYLGRLRRAWLWSGASATWLLLGIIPILFFQTAVHEGSHCLMMAASGLGCRVMAPFSVTLGRASVYGVTLPADEGAGMPTSIVVAPQVVAAILIVALRLGSARLRDERWALLTRLWLLGACVDLTNNTLWRPHGGFGDWSVMASQLGLSSGVVFAVSVPAWLLALWGLLAPLPTDFARRAASARDLWEIGVVYAGISSLAVAVSTLVEVPDSDPTSLWHRVPILLQAASVVVCLAMVAASRLTRREAA